MKTYVLKIPVSFQEEVDLVPTGPVTETSLEIRTVVQDEARVEDVREAFALQFASVVKLGSVIAPIEAPPSRPSIKRPSKPIVGP